MSLQPLFQALRVFVVATRVLRGFRRTPPAVDPANDQAVILKLKLPSGESACSEETQRIEGLEERIEEEIDELQTGEYDRDEYGDGFCTIYMYGPNADSLYSSIQPILNSFPFLPGSYALKRYGKPGSPQVQIPMAGE